MRLPLIFLAVLVLPLSLGAAVFPPLTPEQLAQIAAAVPPKAKAAPLKPRRLLVFYRTEGYVHDSIPFGVEAIREMGEKTGAYSVDASDDMAVFTPAKLGGYDAILFISTTGLKFAAPVQRQLLLDFVKGGKGFIGIHAAADNFPSWPEARELLGGQFKSHPWGAGDTEAVKVDDPGSPITASFGGAGFWIKDEIYQIVGPYDRTRQHVLLSLDMSKSQNRRDPSTSKIVRTDDDFPIAWIKKTPEGGRVFYSSLGHNRNLFSTPQILQHYLDGIQFVLGDLPADATPSAVLNPAPVAALAPDAVAILNAVPMPPSPPSPKLISDGAPAPVAASPAVSAAPAYAEALKSVPSYDWGQDRAGVIVVEEQVRARKSEAEKDLLAILADPASTIPARQFAVRQLTIAGTKESVRPLARLLGDPKLGVLAASALIGLPDSSADAALVEALDGTSGSAQLQIANVAGRRHLVAALPVLARLAGSANPEEALAGLVSLGDLGGIEALHALQSAKVAPELRPARDRALLQAALSLLDPAAGAGRAEAVKALSEMTAGNVFRSIRLGALRGLIAADGVAALPSFTAMLADNDPAVRAPAASLASGFSDPGAVLGALGGKLATLDPSVEAVLLEALSDKANPTVKGTLETALKHPDPAVRLAALRGLRRVGDAQTVPLLLPFLAQNDAEGKEAATTLSRLGGPSLRPLLRQACASSQGMAKAALIQVLANRADHDSFARIVEATGDSDKAVRTAAFQALALLAGPDDLDVILGIVPQSDGEKRLFGKTVAAAALATANHDQAAGRLVTAFGAATDDDLRQELCGSLATLGGPTAFDFLQNRLRSTVEAERRGAIKALAGSKNLAAMPVLLDAAAKGPTPAEKILALRGYLDLLTVPAQRSKEESFAAYKAAWPIAGQPQEKEAILAAIGKIDLPAAKEFAQANKTGI